jgi:hypothetical protein
MVWYNCGYLVFVGALPAYRTIGNLINIGGVVTIIVFFNSILVCDAWVYWVLYCSDWSRALVPLGMALNGLGQNIMYVTYYFRLNWGSLNLPDKPPGGGKDERIQEMLVLSPG